MLSIRHLRKALHVTNALTSFVVGENGFVLHFFLKDVIETNMNVKFADTTNAIEVMFTLGAESKEQADKWAEEVEGRRRKDNFESRKSSGKDIMALFSQILTDILLPYFICKLSYCHLQ